MDYSRLERRTCQKKLYLIDNFSIQHFAAERKKMNLSPKLLFLELEKGYTEKYYDSLSAELIFKKGSQAKMVKANLVKTSFKLRLDFK